MSKSIWRTAAVGAAAVWMWWTPGNGEAQTPASGLSPDLQEVVRLSQAQMPEDVIKNYIISTGKPYRLSADDIIYLNSQGVSPGVISVLQAAGAAPNPPPTAAPAAAPPTAGNAASPGDEAGTAASSAEANFQYFHDQLAPYGTWVNVEGTLYWRPDQAVAVDPDWRPYYDMGQWVETENGLYWQSDYTWGDIPFHYGRWVLYPGMGWLWAPDYVWGPAWVFWRHDEADGVIGWAPLPAGAVFVDGGFRYRGAVVAADFDFGLGEACFTFVGYDHFHERFFRMRGHEWAYHVDRPHLHGFYGHSVLRNEFRRDEHGRFVNNGIGRERVERLTHVEKASFEERNPVGDRSRLHKEETRRPEAGPGQLGNARNDSAGKPGVENGVSREPSTAIQRGGGPSAAGKVYRPPAGGGQSRDRR